MRAGGSTEMLETNNFYTLNTGDIVEVISSGGGGFGDPAQREPEKVLKDVLNGVVSVENARDIYRVDVDVENRCIREAQTEELRTVSVVN